MFIMMANSMVVGLLGTLTPYERLEAMRQLDAGSRSLFTDKWFVLLGWSLIFLLAITFFVVHRMRIEKERKQIRRQFDELAEKLDITAAEREILEAITARSGLRRNDAIFSHPDAFENGLARLMQDVFADGHNLVYRKKLQAAVYSIKQKLGYLKVEAAERPRSIKEQSSRYIPVGKTVQLLLSERDDARPLPAEVVANDEYELVVRPDIPLNCRSGQVWLVRYNAGSVTWQFSAITLGCSEKGLELNHTDRVRFVNRRRFPRVSVRKDAVIARLPMMRPAQKIDDLRPVFFDAEISEISGCALRIRTELVPSVNERVLVVFELEPGRIVQDVGQVRDIRKTPLGLVLIVDLIGLNDRAADELVRMTHQLAGQAANDAVEDEQESVYLEVT